MLVLKMLEDRSLVVTKSNNTYQDENSAEVLKIILPKTLNEIDLKDCHVYLAFTNQAGYGNVCDITSYLTDYSDMRYVIQIPMYKMFTYEPGTIEMWVKILHSPTEMVAKTNVVSHIIMAHKDTDGTIPPQELSIIDQLVTRMDVAEVTVDNISDRVDIVDDKVDDVDGRVEDIEGAVDDIEDEIEDINGKVDDVSGEIDDLAERVDDIVTGDEQITQNVIIGRVHEVESE